MAKNKTVETQHSVSDFLATVADEKKRRDCTTLIDLIEKHTKLEAKMWGPAIVGFGSYHYVYKSGREGDAPLFGLSPRVNAITLYLGTSFDNSEELLSKFGKYKSSDKGCIYIQKLEDIDTTVLMKMIKNSINHTKKTNQC